MSYTIYKATNTANGKCYIGFDSNWPARIQSHKAASRTKKLAFYNAIKKYGWEAFVWEALYQSLDGEYCLNVMEPYFISEYNAYGAGGYNMTKGGEGSSGYVFTEAVRSKMSQAAKGKKKGPMPEQVKIKISAAKRGIPKTQEHKDKLSVALLGNKQSDATRAKKSDSFKGRKQTEEWVRKRTAACVGMVTVVNKSAKTKSMAVDEYRKQMVGNNSEWVTNRSNEGRRRLGEI